MSDPVYLYGYGRKRHILRGVLPSCPVPWEELPAKCGASGITSSMAPYGPDHPMASQGSSLPLCKRCAKAAGVDGG